MGKWIYKVPEPVPVHKHDMPPYSHGMKTGDVWECSCMSQFEATISLQEGSQVQYNVEWRAMWIEEWK